MIAIDWGTTSFRAYRLDDEHRVVASREARAGILAVPEGRFAATLLAEVGSWIDGGERHIVMSGMIGSRQGWREAPYVPTPAGASAIAAALVPVEVATGLQAWIVPGLITLGSDGTHDVMRGEETQILGVLDALGPGTHRLCLPGTHSKWVDVRDGVITAFRTHMTGEMFAVLRDHSILGRTLDLDAPFDAAAFEAGVARSASAHGLLHHLFGVRAEHLAGRLPARSVRDHLSGILLGHELRSEAGEAPVHLLGNPELVQRYDQACRVLGRSAGILDPQAAAAGIGRIARARSLPGQT